MNASMRVMDFAAEVAASRRGVRGADVFRFSVSALRIVGLVCALQFAVSTADAVPLVIDDFSEPDPIDNTIPSNDIFVIEFINNDPTLIQQDEASILGGQRDVLVDVVGTPGNVSATGEIGEGQFVFNSANPGSVVSLQYDGVDADVQPDLDDALDLGGEDGFDLTQEGHQKGIRISFLTFDAGPEEDSVPIDIVMTGPGGASAQLPAGTEISESAPTQTYTFSSFVLSGGFSFTAVTSITIIINSPGTQADVDFVMTEIAVVPEPSVTALCLSGAMAIGMRVLHARRRRRMTSANVGKRGTLGRNSSQGFPWGMA